MTRAKAEARHQPAPASVSGTGMAAVVEPRPQAQALDGGRSLKLMLNTDVWVNYYLDRGPRHPLAGKMIVEAARHDVTLYTSACCLNEAYRVINSELQRMAREAAACLGDSAATTDPDARSAMLSTAKDTAWSCITNLLELSTIVPAGQTEALRAISLRPAHDDFEDDMLLAAALRVNADYLVTDDETLRRDAPLSTLDVEEALELLQSL